MINRALQTQDIKVIVKMRLFIQDFHRQLEQIKINDKISTISYRSQNLSNDDFQKKMKTSQDNPLSFNNFMLADTNYETALDDTSHERINNNAVGVLFRIEVESTQASIPFVSLTNLSYLAEQGKYVLFSMHSVFRILEVKQIEDHLWQTIFPAALKYFEKVLQIRLKTYSPYNSSLAITYNNIGLIHREMEDYSQAISFFQKSLEIKQKIFTSYHPSLAITYNNIGEINQLMGEFSQALMSYQKALEIHEKTFSLNHSELATTYDNIGITHQSIGNYSIALSFYQKALKTRQKSLSASHPSVSTSYNSIEHLYQSMGDYNIALEYYQKTQKLQEKSLDPNHPSLAAT
ncbi:unnamed protein product [Rotaria sp. Silwood1]|nr:unnamed protein product [Rotaria sp. Silwood1]